ncbi:hypothetical protein NPIL_320231, partial [Nephila pilipes]
MTLGLSSGMPVLRRMFWQEYVPTDSRESLRRPFHNLIQLKAVFVLRVVRFTMGLKNTCLGNKLAMIFILC